jgi:hypothetical protein
VGFAPLLRAFFCALGPLMSKNKLPHTKNYVPRQTWIAVSKISPIFRREHFSFLRRYRVLSLPLLTIGKNNDIGS